MPPGGGYPPPGGGFPNPGGMPPGGGNYGQLAEWPARAQAGLIDYFGPAILAVVVSLFISNALGSLIGLAALGWGFYNGYLNGETGQSFGKKTVGLKLVGEQTGQVIGGGNGVVRVLCHFVDSVICYIGYLFPLWDAKKQTIADKIMKTVVITVPKG